MYITGKLVIFFKKGTERIKFAPIYSYGNVEGGLKVGRQLLITFIIQRLL